MVPPLLIKPQDMKKIPSFTIDHIKLNRGIYVSRKDEIGGETVTTFDIRMKLPNREPVLGQGAIHTIEHLAATFLRNHPVCGNYLLHDLPMARYEARKYVEETLNLATEENLVYPE